MWLFQIRLNCGMLHTSDAINLCFITISQCFCLWHFSPVLWTCSCNNTQLVTSRWEKNKLAEFSCCEMQLCKQLICKQKAKTVPQEWKCFEKVWKWCENISWEVFFKPPNVIYLWIKNIHLIASDLFFSLQHSKQIHSYFSAIISKVRGGGE